MVAHDQPAAEAAMDPHCLQGSNLNLGFKIILAQLFNTDFASDLTYLHHFCEPKKPTVKTPMKTCMHMLVTPRHTY